MSHKFVIKVQVQGKQNFPQSSEARPRQKVRQFISRDVNITFRGGQNPCLVKRVIYSTHLGIQFTLQIKIKACLNLSSSLKLMF